MKELVVLSIILIVFLAGCTKAIENQTSVAGQEAQIKTSTTVEVKKSSADEPKTYQVNVVEGLDVKAR